MDAEKSRVGGWLTFFCFCLIVFGPAYHWQLAKDTMDAWPPPYDKIEAAYLFILSFAGVVVGGRIATQAPAWRAMAKWYLAARLLASFAVLAMLWPIISLEKGVTRIGTESLIFAVWFTYFSVSERVNGSLE